MKDPMQIVIKENGERIGQLSCEKFRAGLQAPKNMRIAEVIDRYNETMGSNGDSLRAELILVGGKKWV